MSKNIQANCRICLRLCKSRHVSLQDSFPEGTMMEPISYAQAYEACTQLEVPTESDGMPEYLCNSCSRDLQHAYGFRYKAIQSYEKLLNQIKLQKQEKIARAVSPSEFELPDNHTAAAYMRADADIIDACSTTVEKHLKDPLQDSESDNEIQSHLEQFSNKLQSPAHIRTYSDNAYDSEDEKPLKHLIFKEERNMAENYDLDENSVASTKTTFVLSSNEPLYDDDNELREDENPVNEKITDSMFSPEAHIFPKGRFKCAICEQSYFTSVGLKAHIEVHLAKSITAKKKRTRSKKRKTSIKRSSDVEVSTVDASCDNSNPCQSTNSEKLEKENEQDNQNYTKKRKPKEPKPKRMFPCHVCGKHMISASKLRYHMVMHTGEKDYLCTMCPKAYSTIYALKHHIRTHTGERPYECKFCGDRFLRPTTLKSHQRRHTGERPYGCDICGKRFIQHSSMTTHMKLNHMDKTIQCPHCDKKYARQTDLNTHLLSHTGDKPYPCQLCPSRFVRQANLNKHMNQQHAFSANLSSGNSGSAAKKISKDGACMVGGSKTKVVPNFLGDNKTKLISQGVDAGVGSSNAMTDENFTSVSNIVDNCCNFLSSQRDIHMHSEQSSQILPEDTYEQLDSGDLVLWNC